jgi:hypothetical protein
MKTPDHQRLNAEIMEVTNRIRIEFPEAYRVMSETPFFTSRDMDHVTTTELEDYLTDIRGQLDTFRSAKTESK